MFGSYGVQITNVRTVNTWGISVSGSDQEPEPPVPGCWTVANSC